MVAVTGLAVTGGGGSEVTAKATAKEARILSDHLGRKQTRKRPKSLYFQKISAFIGLHRMLNWWAHQDSNLEPKDYESSALTVELWARRAVDIVTA